MLSSRQEKILGTISSHRIFIGFKSLETIKRCFRHVSMLMCMSLKNRQKFTNSKFLLKLAQTVDYVIIYNWKKFQIFLTKC